MVITPAEASQTSNIQLKNCLSTNPRALGQGGFQQLVSRWPTSCGAVKLSGAGTQTVTFPFAPLRHGNDYIIGL